MVVLAVAAGLHGLLYVPLVSTNEETDSWSYLAAANAIRDGSYSTPLKAGFYFVFPVGWFDLTGARIPERVWQEPENQVFRAPGYPAYVALFGEREVFAGEHVPVLLGQGVLFGLGAWFLMLSVRRWWGDERRAARRPPLRRRPVVEALRRARAQRDARRDRRARGRLRLHACVGVAPPRVVGRAREHSSARSRSCGRSSSSRSRSPFSRRCVARGTTRERLVRAAATAAAAAAFLVPWLAWTNHVVGRPTMQVWGEAYNLILAASGEGHARTSAEIEADPAFQSADERDPRARAVGRRARARPDVHIRATSSVRTRGCATTRSSSTASDSGRAAPGRLGGRVPELVPLERAQGLVPARRRASARAPVPRPC